MKTFTLEQIGEITGGMLTKASDVAITNIAPPKLADENTLALALGEDEIANLSTTKAKAALVPLGVNIDGFTTIEVERPRLAMMKLISMFYEEPGVNSGIHPSAVVASTAKIGHNVSIGQNVVIAYTKINSMYLAGLAVMNLDNEFDEELLANMAPILILDDSSSALDYKTDSKIRSNLNNYNLTQIIVAQRVSSIINCDKILVIDDGKIIGYGNHSELLNTCKEYRYIYDIQMGDDING